MASKDLVKIKKKYHHGDLKDQLLEAVRQLVETHGADGFKIAEACRLAGVSTAAPYKHFKDRDDILRHLVLAAMRRMGTAMRMAAESYPAGDPRRIVALGRSYTDFAKAEPGMFSLIFGMAKDHDGDAELLQEGKDKLGIVRQVVAEHLGADPEDREVGLRAYALWCAVHGHAFLVLDGKTEEALDALSDEAYLTFVGASYLP